MGDVRAVWTDFGGVLTPPLVETYSVFEKRTGILGEDFLAALAELEHEFGEPAMAPMDTGSWTQARWGRRMAAALERRTGVRHDLTRFGDLWFADRPTNTRLVEFLDALRQRGLLIGLLTNNVREWEPHWRAMLPEHWAFDSEINSCELGIRKPDPRIFELAAQSLDVPPKSCLLIDDQPVNCHAATASGWRAVLFQSNDQAIDEVEKVLAGTNAWTSNVPEGAHP